MHDDGDRRGQIFTWSASDWDFLQRVHALDLEYFAGSMLFQIWARKNLSLEQQEYLESLNVGFRKIQTRSEIVKKMIIGDQP